MLQHINVKLKLNLRSTSKQLSQRYYLCTDAILLALSGDDIDMCPVQQAVQSTFNMTLPLATKQRHTDVTEAETEKQINKSTYLIVKINSNFKDRVIAVFF